MALMKHREHGGIAELPDIPFWRNAGWEPTDERPAEPDPHRDPPPAGAATTEAPDETLGLSATPPEKPATTAKTKKETTDRG